MVVLVSTTMGQSVATAVRGGCQTVNRVRNEQSAQKCEGIQDEGDVADPAGYRVIPRQIIEAWPDQKLVTKSRLGNIYRFVSIWANGSRKNSPVSGHFLLLLRAPRGACGTA